MAHSSKRLVEHTLEDATPVPHYSFGDIVVDAERRRLTRAGRIAVDSRPPFRRAAGARGPPGFDRVQGRAHRGGLAGRCRHGQQPRAGRVGAAPRARGRRRTGSPISRQCRGRDIVSSAPSARSRRAPATMSSRRCWRRIAPGSKGELRSKRSSATRSSARVRCSKACSNARRIMLRRTSVWPTPASCSSR